MRGYVNPDEPVTQFFTTSDFQTDSAIVLPLLKLAYKTYGVLDAPHKVVLVSTCFGEKVSHVVRFV
jgi:homoserine acetyltransferase